MRLILKTGLALGMALLATAQDKPKQILGTVYVLPMRNGFDQYVSNHLVQRGYSVVTTSAMAQYIVTDSLGQGFERALEQIRESQAPKPKREMRLEPVEPEPAQSAEAKTIIKSDKETPREKELRERLEDAEKERKEERRREQEKIDMEEARRISDAEVNSRPVSTFTRGRGNVFIVEVAQQRVVWSDYDRPKGARSWTLDNKAKDLVNEIAKKLAPPGN
jgi:hypothetical protein